MEESTSVALLAGLLALVAKELIVYLRSRKSNGASSNPGNPHPQPTVDLSGIEGKLDKLATAVDGLSETQAKTNRALDDLAHSGDKTRQALADQQEILEWLRKAERQRE
jgi:hypothetical protein